MVGSPSNALADRFAYRRKQPSVERPASITS
jgi:hypothetical protein